MSAQLVFFSTPLERSRFALFGESARGFLKVFAEIKFMRRGLHHDLA
jgi:hypothetical protein